MFIDSLGFLCPAHMYTSFQLKEGNKLHVNSMTYFAAKEGSHYKPCKKIGKYHNEEIPMLPPLERDN